MCLYFLQCDFEVYNCSRISQCDFISCFKFYLNYPVFYSEAAGLHTLAHCVACLVEQIWYDSIRFLLCTWATKAIKALSPVRFNQHTHTHILETVWSCVFQPLKPLVLYNASKKWNSFDHRKNKRKCFVQVRASGVSAWGRSRSKG